MSSSHSQVGYLVPLNQNLEEAASASKLAVSDGTNVIGRNNLAVSDKRLSRKHLTITASTDGTANLHVVLLTINRSTNSFLEFFFVFFLIRDFRFRRGRIQLLLIPGIREGS